MVKDTTLCESQSLVALDDLVSQDCYVACPDECVLESWSEWSACDRDCSEQRKRTRRILRQDKNLQCNDTEVIQVRIYQRSVFGSSQFRLKTVPLLIVQKLYVVGSRGVLVSLTMMIIVEWVFLYD